MPTRRKQTYAECVAEGRCPGCHRLLGPEEEFKSCDACRNRAKQSRLARAKRGLCKSCSNKAIRANYCSEHLKNACQYGKKRREQRRDAGRCQRCNVPASKSYCEDCAAKQAVVFARRRTKLLASGRCTACAEPAIPKRTLCPSCAERWATKSREREQHPARRQEQRTRAAQRKVAWVADGLCGGCGQRAPLPGRKRCGVCAERSRIARSIRMLRKRTQYLLAENKRNPAHSALDPSALRKLRKV